MQLPCQALLQLLVLCLALPCLCACAQKATDPAPLGQKSFEAYRTETIAWLRRNRTFISKDTEREIAQNAPREWRPKNAGRAPAKGMLLVHGLGDSPWTFSDIGPKLAENGFLVRTVLLPGCGSKPADMIGVSVNDWRRVVAEQARILQAETGELYLGGFSAGANLALEYAADNAKVKGLALFSPAFKSAVPIAFLAPPAALLTNWLFVPKDEPMQIASRYLIMPVNAFAQFYHSSTGVRERINREKFDRPVFIAITQHDSVLDTGYVLDAFTKRFTHPDSCLIWYGGNDEFEDQRIIARSDFVPEDHISEFSHISLLFSPSNAEFGRNGSIRLCWNGQSKEDFSLCQKGEGNIWYSDFGFREEGKVHARLTYNPFFDWQVETLAKVPGFGL